MTSASRSGLSLVEVMIAMVVLATVALMASEFASTAARHDVHAFTVDSVDADVDIIRGQISAELSGAGWYIPGSDPATPSTTPGWETALTSGRLTTSVLLDRELRYWPYVMSSRIARPDATETNMPYIELDPSVDIDRTKWTPFTDAIPGMRESIADSVSWSEQMGTFTSALPEASVLTARIRRDREWAYAPSRHLIYLSLLNDAWRPNPIETPSSVVALGSTSWNDQSIWSASAPATRWTANEQAGIIPISSQWESVTGSSLWDPVPDALRFDIEDAYGAAMDLNGISVPRGHGRTMTSGILAVDAGGSGYRIVPQWDTVDEPSFSALDANHDRWRDRGLYLIRSPVSDFGRLVIAAKMDVTNRSIGTGPGDRISRYLDANGCGMVIIKVLSDHVIRMTADTWRTALDKAVDLDDQTTDHGMDVHDIRIRLWMAKSDRSQQGSVVVRPVSFMVSMLAKTSEEDRLIDRSMVTRLRHRHALR